MLTYIPQAKKLIGEQAAILENYQETLPEDILKKTQDITALTYIYKYIYIYIYIFFFLNV